MCDFPIHLKNVLLRNLEDYSILQVPCGKCHSCITSRINDWWVRLKYELKNSTSAHFITLTYANPPVSLNGHYTGNKDHLRKFFNRLRHYDSSVKLNPLTKRKYRQFNSEIKYYAVLEYGKKYQRPHYHIILFGIKNIRSAYNAWAVDKKPIGSMHVGKVEDASIRYVTGYIGKKIGIPVDDADDRLPEFSNMSKGLGLGYVNSTGKFNIQNEEGYTVVDGKTYRLPRYLKNKLFPQYKMKVHGKVKYLPNPIAKAIGKKNQSHAILNEQFERQKFSSNEDYEINKWSVVQAKNNQSPKNSKFS